MRVATSILLALIIIAAAFLTWQLVVGEEQVQLKRPFPVTPTYPDVVALVNGQPISGSTLDILIQSGGQTPQAALDTLINEELLYQAGERLGLLATEEEITASLEAEEDARQYMTDAQEKFVEWFYGTQGISTTDLASNPRLREVTVVAVTIANVREFVAKSLAASKLTGVPVQDIETPGQVEELMRGISDSNALVEEGELEAAVQEFLLKEKAKADVEILIDP
ncbi:MAG: hypothetical protein WBD55_01940 [Dehalococcoidia bacterium]